MLCYVINNFLKHILVKGLKEYVRDNTTLNEKIISRIVDPTQIEIDHKDINEGTGLVLSNEDACLITKDTNSRLCLKDKRLILDDTYFGIAISGKVPNSLLANTEVVQANWAIPQIIHSEKDQKDLWRYQIDSQEDREVETIDRCETCSHRYVLEDQLKILEDKEDSPVGDRIHYLSHRTIEKKSSKTTKGRIVMGASARPNKYDNPLDPN